MALPDNHVLEPLPAEENAYGLKNRMYPNPFRDDITVDFNNIAGTNRVSAFVYDITGRLVFRQDYSNLVAGFNQLRLKTGSLKVGRNAYTVVLATNGTIIMVNKMIKK